MKRRDAKLLVAALVLLAIPAVWLWHGARTAEKRREQTLAGVPQFPAPHQPVRQRPINLPRKAPPPPPAAQPAAQSRDPMSSFVLADGAGALVHVNALLNTPMFDRLRQCNPQIFAGFDRFGSKLGIDPAYDIDRVATAPGGIAMTGFFEGKPVAQSLLEGSAPAGTYRGASLYSRDRGCAGQLGNLVVVGSSADGCRALIDRALTPTPPNAQDELYGDIFARSDLADFRDAKAPPEIRSLADSLQSVTLHANVWDSVALTVEGEPLPGRDPRDLAQMAKGAISLVKSQLDEDEVELQALAGLAKVSTETGKLELNLALPAQDLFDRLHFPCPGRDGGI